MAKKKMKPIDEVLALPVTQADVPLDGRWSERAGHRGQPKADRRHDDAENVDYLVDKANRQYRAIDLDSGEESPWVRY